MRIRLVVTLVLFVLGGLLTVLAILADPLGLDVTPGFGVIQMVGLLTGITLLTLATYLYMLNLRPANLPRSLQADIGVRLAATGLVFVIVTGLSDLIGIGTHVNPAFERPFVGPLQLGGITLGMVVIITGLFLFHTSRGRRTNSSMEFLVNGNKSDSPEDANTQATFEKSEDLH